MKRILLILLVAVSVYSVAWVALAKLGEKELAKTIKTESVKVTGYPERFTATFEKPQVMIGNSLLTSEQPLQVSRNIAGSEYHFILPRDITTHSGPSVVTCHFTKPADMLVSVEPLALEKQQYPTLQSMLKDPKFYAAFRKAEYKDAGAVCVNEKFHSRYTYTQGNFTVRNEKKEAQSVLYYKGAMVGDVNLAFDVELDGYDPFLANAFPDNSELRINTLRVQTPRYQGNVGGYVKLNKTDPFPYGLVTVNAQNISSMLDDLYGAPGQHLPNREKLNTLLFRLANAQPADQSLTIIVKRKGGEDIQIGTMRLAEFLMNWAQLFADNNNSWTQ